MAFKITISGMADLIKMISSTKKYEYKVRNLIKGLNWQNVGKAVRKAVKNEMKRAGYNEKGVRARKIIAGFGVDKFGGVNVSKKGYNRSFRIHQPIGERKEWFKHASKRKEFPSVDSEFILNFMSIGHTRPRYTIPETEGSGIMIMKDRYGITKTGWLTLSKQKLHIVNPVEGKADFTGVVNDVMSAWLNRIGDKFQKFQDEM